MDVKEVTTVDQQIELFIRRGCIICDRTFAERVLSNVNYYRFSAYLLPFRTVVDGETQYKENITFEKVFHIYEFDRKLRRLLFDAIDEIEIMLRRELAGLHALEYGKLGYEYSRSREMDEESISKFMAAE